MLFKLYFWSLSGLVLAVLVAVVIANGYEDDPLFKCLQDEDYDILLHIINNGLAPAKTPRHVVVVGAGIAGLTAAKFLQDAGHKVTIIEASNRIGGRVETYQNPEEGWYAELGAMRIPSFHKILLKFLQNMHVKTNSFIQYNPNTYYFVNGKLLRTYAVHDNPDLLGYPLAPSEEGKSASDLFSLALQPVNDLKKSGYNCKTVMRKYDSFSVKEYLVKEANLSRGALRMIGDILNENGFFYTALTETLYIQADINDNTTYFEITGGFDKLLKTFYRVLNCTILFEATVKAINQTKRGVTVYFEKKANKYTLDYVAADYVLVATTAKAALFMDFQPPLSASKMEALRSVHYSGSTKVVLSFKERFWENGGYGGKTITDLPARFIYYPSHNFTGQGGAILASYTYSDEAALFDGTDEEELKAIMLDNLAKIHGEEIRDVYTGGVVKKWGRDPFSHGAFAIFTPYQKIDYLKELCKNEKRIYFAGEHAGAPHGWIETAMKSALRAVQKINNRNFNDI
uniref:Amine oxidase n=1 Tax=Scleropages formosus TaxID=113540 RepID=A0A8C9VKL7_SCLFO